jgi:glycine cleavage system aminomethyltransferase T
VFASRGGHPTAINFGSPAGELAVCVSAVGIVDRSDLTQLVVSAPPRQLARLVERLTGLQLAPGGALEAAGAWWCAASAERVIVISEHVAAGRLRARLRTEALRHASLTVEDRSPRWAAIELVGRRTPKVLHALGAFGDSGDIRQAQPFATGTLDGVGLTWLLESDRRALALVPRADAGTVWRAIEEAGRHYGLSCVGQEAASRYRLLERTAH